MYLLIGLLIGLLLHLWIWVVIERDKVAYGNAKWQLGVIQGHVATRWPGHPDPGFRAARKVLDELEAEALMKHLEIERQVNKYKE